MPVLTLDALTHASAPAWQALNIDSAYRLRGVFTQAGPTAGVGCRHTQPVMNLQLIEMSPHPETALSAGDALDVNLPYGEPRGWMQLNRHALGTLLLEQNRVNQAEMVYRADLGFDKALARADVEIHHSCLRRGVCPHEHTHQLQWSPYKQE